MPKLFDPLQVKGIEFKNRIVVSPMCQYSSEDGFANDWHLVHLGTRAVGGAGLVFTEATAVTPRGRISPQDLGIWKDEHIEYLKRITDFIHARGSVAGIQLAHAGRKASTDVPWRGMKKVEESDGGWKPAGPSPIAYKEGDHVPHELNKEEIKSLVQAFRDAAIRALKAGFKVIEIHAAHGYLINEFMSPASNFRNDEYGGSFENRIKFLLEIIDAIKEVWPKDNPLFVRLSASEWSEKGWTIGDSVKLAMILKEKEIDLIDCSSGGNVHGAKINVAPMYQTPFAEQVRGEAGIMTGAVGLITSAQQCEQIIAEGKADMVFLARQLLRDPYFPLNAAKELGADIPWPDQYLRAK